MCVLPDICECPYLWAHQTYKTVANLDLDTLWQVEDEFLRVPHWSTTVSPDKRAPEAASVFPDRQKTDGSRAALQVPDGSNSDPSSLPDLIESPDDTPINSVAAGSDHDDKSEDESDLDGEDRNGYDSEEESELQDLEREAMDIAIAYPEIFEEKKAFEERSNDNQLLKALGALRGEYLMSTIGIKDVHNPVKTEHRPPIFL
jgi:hypothetical protein